MNIPNPFKPWFVYRPGQLLRRVMRVVSPPREPSQLVTLPWGCQIEVDIRETIGQSVWTAGVYDLAVTEVLSRLAHPEQLSIDVGANIGAMTGALAARSGEVWAFEPHPTVFRRLTRNIDRFSLLPGFSLCRAWELALSDADGEAWLEAPVGFEGNHGLARMTAGSGGAEGFAVRTRRLDAVIGDRRVGVLKVDVEGHELAVLRGASSALATGQITHVVFENHEGPEAPPCRFLSDLGYTLFEIGWRLTGVVLATPGASAAHRYEAQSFLATRVPDLATARCRPRGWESFRRPPRAR